MLFSGVPHTPLLEYVTETAAAEYPYSIWNCSVNGISGSSSVSLMVLFSCRGVSSNQRYSGKMGKMMV